MTKIIGHRGARGLAPENTLAALAAGLKYGVDELEIDVRVTKDGVPVLHHNTRINGPGGFGFVRYHTLEELQGFKGDLVTLDEAAKFVNHRARLLIEVKPRVDIAPVVAVLKELLQEGWQPQDFLLGSFSQRTLRTLHKALPKIEKVVIARFSGVYSAMRARQVNTKRISLWRYVIWFGFIRSMHTQEYQLCAYTVNDPKKAARWAADGLYGVITDYPDRYKAEEV